MATSFTISFDSIYLTAELPEVIGIRTDQESISVTVLIDGDEVFSSVYYPYNRMVYFRDVRSIVESAMLEQECDMASLEIEANEDSGYGTVTEEAKVIYSMYRSPYGSEVFLANSFLSLRKSALIPRNGYLNLYNYTKAYAQGSNYAMIYYTQPEIPGVVSTYNCYLGKVQSSWDRIILKRLTYDYFKEVVDDYRQTDSEVLGVEYQIGSRRFNIFFTDEKPTDMFTFLNAFGLLENYYLYGATTTKTEVERSEAVCGWKTLYYDETISIRHEVETAPLPYNEAMWLSQMLTSKWVAVQIASRDSATRKTAEVLTSDIAAEVTDNDKELIRVKFSWKYAEGAEWMKDKDMF